MKRTASANAKSRSSSAKRGGSFVVCIDNSGYPASLQFGKVYRALPATARVPDGWLRIIDEAGEDYLYPSRRFVPVELPARAKRALTVSAT